MRDIAVVISNSRYCQRCLLLLLFILVTVITITPFLSWLLFCPISCVGHCHFASETAVVSCLVVVRSFRHRCYCCRCLKSLRQLLRMMCTMLQATLVTRAAQYEYLCQFSLLLLVSLCQVNIVDCLNFFVFLYLLNFLYFCGECGALCG